MTALEAGAIGLVCGFQSEYDDDDDDDDVIDGDGDDDDDEMNNYLSEVILLWARSSLIKELDGGASGTSRLVNWKTKDLRDFETTQVTNENDDFQTWFLLKSSS